MISILFVCLGNICRSPMAEAIFRHLIYEHGLESKIHVDSAGIAEWHVGKPPHIGTLTELKRQGISADGLIGRQMSKMDLEEFDLIIAMDSKNIASIKALTSDELPKLHLLTEFSSDPAMRDKDVPDPYHTNRFEETYQLIEDCCKGLLGAVLLSQFD